MPIFIDFDLDWLNDCDDPVKRMETILRHLPNYLPVMMAIEHQGVLEAIDRYTQHLGEFDILHIDQHHDFYALKRDGDINCANWGYYLPNNYRKFTWVKNKCSDRIDICEMEAWFNQINKRLIYKDNIRFDKINQDNIVAAFFCVSPDYCSSQLLGKITTIIDIIADHFCLDVIPIAKDPGWLYSVHNWKLKNRENTLCGA